MMQARSQAHSHLLVSCFHKLHSGNAETGAGQASPTTSGQTQSHMDRWPPQDTASNGMCAGREEKKNLAKIRHT